MGVAAVGMRRASTTVGTEVGVGVCVCVGVHVWSAPSVVSGAGASAVIESGTREN